MLKLFRSKTKADRARILIVDDEPDLVSTIQCRLEANNYNVVTAADGQEGLIKAAKEKPDLILLDTNMPVMNGHEMLERLRKHPDLKNIPVIMCTAICGAQDIATVSSYDVTDYITKPLDCMELMEKVANALQNRSSE